MKSRWGTVGRGAGASGSLEKSRCKTFGTIARHGAKGRNKCGAADGTIRAGLHCSIIN